MNGAFYSHAEWTAPWGLTLPPMGNLWFHAVISGRALLEAPGAPPTWLGRGDLGLVAHGRGHLLRSDSTAEALDFSQLDDARMISDRYEEIRHGGGGAPTTAICGAFVFDHPAARDVLEVLPPVIHIEPIGRRSDWLPQTLGMMAAEAREARPGGEAVITRLADIVVIQAIRSWLENDPGAHRGWLGALSDARIGPAIAQIHRHPERAWTVSSLADEAAMSRSAFAACFKDLVGEPVMQYVTRWRMQVAHEALRSEGATVGELAARLGYRSDAAFARAFKRVLGVSPGSAKRAADGTSDHMS